MRNSFWKLFCMLFVLSFLGGCGANNILGTSPDSGKGSISAKLTWASGKESAKAVAAIPAGVATLRLTVTGADAAGQFIPVVRKDLAVTSATVAGQVDGIYPGTVSMAVTAFDGQGAAVYEGFAMNVAVTAGVTTNVGTVKMSPPLVKAADSSCLNCHELTQETNGGQSIVATYKQSGHYPNSSAGCAACHGASHNIPNPFASGRCFECHAPAAAQHSNEETGSGERPAEYLATNYKDKCSSCHVPFQHDTKNSFGFEVRHAWAKSGHGNVNGVAWSSEDLQIPAELACQRCHTTTGFKKFVARNYSSLTVSIASATDKTREVLACDGCHTDNSFKLRTAAPFTTPYKANGGSNLVPDVGESNICIPCHTGRASQADILAISDTAIANSSFKNPHYMPAAGIMYLKVGFTSFTSAGTPIGTSTYGKSYSLALTGVNAAGYPLNGAVDAQYGGISGGVTSTHRALGTPTIRGRETWMQNSAVNGLWETKGPCVTCHIKADITNMPALNSDTTKAPFLDPKYGRISSVRFGAGHSLSATGYDTNKQTCIPCHNDEGGLGDPAVAGEDKLMEAKPYFLAGLSVMTQLFSTKYNITFDNSSYPYFFEKGTTNAVKDWTRGGKLAPARARMLMGAAYNLKLMSADKGAYVHGRTYSQRLIYDTIDFLDDGVMNATAAATIVAMGDPQLFPSTVADHWLFKAKGVRK